MLIENLNKRMDHNMNLIYQNVHCHYAKCNINYYKYLYGMDWGMLDDVHSAIKLDKKLRINDKWYKCAGCQCVYYCGRNCQKRDWIKHRLFCDKLQIC